MRQAAEELKQKSFTEYTASNKGPVAAAGQLTKFDDNDTGGLFDDDRILQNQKQKRSDDPRPSKQPVEQPVAQP